MNKPASLVTDISLMILCQFWLRYYNILCQFGVNFMKFYELRPYWRKWFLTKPWSFAEKEWIFKYVYVLAKRQIRQTKKWALLETLWYLRLFQWIKCSFITEPQNICRTKYIYNIYIYIYIYMYITVTACV